MGTLPCLILVLLVLSVPMYLLVVPDGRFVVKSAQTGIKQAIRRLDKKSTLLRQPSEPQNVQSKRTSIKKSVTKFARPIVITAVVAVAIISGHSVSAQLAPLPLASLKTLPVPEPDNLSTFIKDKTAAIKLGKTLFWDMQVGSDSNMSCASCHFHAGADNRSKNQINPGPDTVFNIGGAPNYQLKPGDFPFHKLSNPNDTASTVISDSNDVASSQGVFNSQFVDVRPGNAVEQVISVPDSVFNVGGINVRQVPGRNSPTVIDAVFNFRNFWDGRAENIFNGVNPFGLRDPNAKVIRANTPSQLEEVKVSLKNASLASQAVGPPMSSFEMSADGRTFQELADKLGSNGTNKGAAKNEKLPRKLGKKLLALRPLGKQLVHPQDSVLGSDSRSPQPGLQTATYDQLITNAFKDEWWKSNRIIQVNADGSRTFLNNPNRTLATNEYTLMEYNFPLFFGLAIQAYESTLISNDTPLDKFLGGNANALTDQQKRGKALFETKAQCIGCHHGAEMTNASVQSVSNQRIFAFPGFNNPKLIFDNGFFNIGVRPSSEDPGVGAKDPFGNDLSESKLAQQGKFSQLLGQNPNVAVAGGDIILTDGAFKTPGLRNVELTAPYFHNGGQLTLEQVVEFYNRGGDFQGGVLQPLGLTDAEKQDLVAFLKGLTDERVRLEKAPFDHPQLLVPNGHPGDTTAVTNDGTGKATDAFLEIPAVGRNGGSGSANFLETSVSSVNSVPSANPLQGRITQQDCPSGTTLRLINGGYACMSN
ncbi:MAG: cytochrome c peroxidase [Nostocaceae cyanobacterium]|nr:cytochrome c peroxidase [Nostocaceae cyanobacterium]